MKVKRQKTRASKVFYSTGCTILDLAIADRLPGGIPGGRITHIFGWESSGKTVIGLEPLGVAQRAGGKAFYDDVEYAIDERWLEINGVEVDYDVLSEEEPADSKFGYKNSETIEKLFDETILKIIKEIEEKGYKDKAVLTVDSLTALPCKTELEQGLEAGTYGGDRAKQFGRGYRKRLRVMAKNGLAVVCIDQLREKMSTGGYGGGTTYSGGRAIAFYASVQILLKKDGIIENKKGNEIGIVVSFKIVKNKVGPPHREGKFNFIWNHGIDDVATNCEFLKANKLITSERRSEITKEVKNLFKKEMKKAVDGGRKRSISAIEKKINTEIKKRCGAEQKKGWHSFDNKKFQSLADIVQYVEDNNLEKKLRAEVRKIWKEKYKTDPRKKKVRFY